MLALVLVAKLCSTAATVGSGAVGGVFTPTLFVGAAIGALSGSLLHQVLPDVAASGDSYALVGMGGFLAATTHAPLMSILMIFEMTLDYQVVLPLMLACVTAHYAAKVYRRGESIYHDSLHREPATAQGDEWRSLVVGALTKPCRAVVQRDTPLRKVLNELPRRPVDAVYVVNAEDELVAYVDPHELLAMVKSGRVLADVEVGSVASPVTLSLRSDMPLGAALDVFLAAKALTLPVTTGQWQTALVGQVSRHDLLLAIQDQLSSTGKVRDALGQTAIAEINRADTP
jgi:chloride channel protein, CIC family